MFIRLRQNGNFFEKKLKKKKKKKVMNFVFEAVCTTDILSSFRWYYENYKCYYDNFSVSFKMSSTVLKNLNFSETLLSLNIIEQNFTLQSLFMPKHLFKIIQKLSKCLIDEIWIIPFIIKLIIQVFFIFVRHVTLLLDNFMF